VLFFILGLALSVPLLLRLYHVGTLLAPAVAVVAFAAIFTFSSVVVAPLLSGSDESPVTPIEQLHDDGHHPEGDPR
jgi:glucose dehydrogenase